MKLPIWFIVFSALLTVGLAGCGSSPTPAAPPTSLDGNWSLAGARTPATYPLLAATLNVQGSQITGQGTLQVQCTPAAAAGLPLFPEEIGGTLPLSGQIAADGTFTMTSPTIGLAPNTYSVSLSGNSPTKTSPNTWTGTYTIQASLGSIISTSPCIYSHSAGFTSLPIAPLAGTYTGPATNGLFGNGLGASAAFTLQVTQGPATLISSLPTSAYELPLGATIAVTGSPCFASGTTVGALSTSQISGDTFAIDLVMNDGSQLHLSGFLNDLGAATLNTTAVVFGGTCSQAISYTTLTRH